MENNNVNETNGANSTSSNNNQNNPIDMAHLEEIINKGISQKETSILKSYFQQAGLSEDEMKEAINSYKANKKNAEIKSNKEFEDLNTNYVNLQKQFNQERLNNAITIALMEKVSKDQIPFISKMIDTEGIMGDKNEINQEKLNENIDAVFKAFPSLVPKKESNQSFVQIGATNNNSNEEGDSTPFKFNFGSVNKK